MNAELLQTSANLNKSVCYWSPQEFFNTNNEARIQRDEPIINTFFNYEHVYRISNLCFDKCVNDFDSTTLSYKENECLNQCKNKSMAYYNDLTFMDVFL